MITSYLFDLYGTLVDIRTDESMPSLWKRMALLLSMQGASYRPKELQQAYLAAVAREIERCVLLRPAVPLEHVEPDILPVFRSLYEQKGVPCREDRAEDTALFFRTMSMVRPVHLYPHVMTVLEPLRDRGKGVYLLSNAQSAFTLPELRKLGLLPCFDGIVISSDVGIKKPDKAFFEHALSKYYLRPETCVMIGNDQEADMGGAASVGIAGRYIHTNLSPERQGSLPSNCREISSLLELIDRPEE